MSTEMANSDRLQHNQIPTIGMSLKWPDWPSTLKRYRIIQRNIETIPCGTPVQRDDFEFLELLDRMLLAPIHQSPPPSLFYSHFDFYRNPSREYSASYPPVSCSTNLVSITIFRSIKLHNCFPQYANLILLTVGLTLYFILVDQNFQHSGEWHDAHVT